MAQRAPRFLALLLAGIATAAPDLPASSPPPDLRALAWRIDPQPVLTRGGETEIDRAVVGDPCIIWDDAAGTWRMFYFASGVDPRTGRKGSRTAMALAASAERIGPGDWRKIGLVAFTKVESLINPDDYHKWWVVMDALRPNHAARIDGRYWALFAASRRLGDGQMHKHIQAASAATLAGPWTVRPEPILAPGTGDELDALHADTPSAFWFEERKLVAIFYKGYPVAAQAEQPRAPFGSGTMLATWHPNDTHAGKVRILLRPGTGEGWNQGWTSSVQLLPPSSAGHWYGLHNGSPTPPADRSHREPAPSLGGWLVCDGDPVDGTWRADHEHSPFRTPEQLSPAEREAGLGVNFWRHHVLMTPGGQVRIYFNSGAYGHEQLYSLTAESGPPGKN